MITPVMIAGVIVITMNIIEELLNEYNFLSDVYIIENQDAYNYIVNESYDTDFSNVSVAIDFVKPIIGCHIKSKTRFANVNQIKR